MTSVGEMPPVAPKSTLETPAKTAVNKTKETVSGGAADGGLKEQMVELQSWEQPFNSLSAIATASVLYNLTAGSGGYSVVNLVCYVLLVRTVLVSAARTVLSGLESHQEGAKSFSSLLQKVVVMVENWLVIPSPSKVSQVVNFGANLVETKTNRVCQVLAEATEPTAEGHRMLKFVVGHLLGAVAVFWFFSIWTVLYLAFMYQMIWPALYAREQERIDDLAAKVWTKAEPFVEKAKAKGGDLVSIAADKLKDVLDKVKAKGVELANKAKVPPKTDDPAGNKTE